MAGTSPAKGLFGLERGLFRIIAEPDSIGRSTNGEATMTEITLRHGIFLPPFHPNEENPTACLERDLDLIVHLDKLGFHEAWIGEHHSAGYEIISSPEIFIAFAAERTRHIRLGTGVVSLPYHHPMMVADRIVQLDHMTRGRVMFGAGPGLLASDAIMMGIDPMTQRDRMAEALDAILRLFKGEIVTETTDWYTMQDARLHLLPYTKPHPEVAVVSAVTPSGGRLAGKYDLSMICVAATNPFGYDALASNWQIACDMAAEKGRTMDANRLRLVGPMHIAETRAQAFENAHWGFERYLGYLNNNQPRFIVPKGEDPLEWFVENKYGVCGTPDDAIALIERLQDKQGEFGVFLQQAHNWADFEATKRSYELYARYVMPHFSQANRPRESSFQWCGDNRAEFSAKRQAAAKAMFDKHEAEQRAARDGAAAARPARGREAW
jgi:limonene 1,2-monooxygenase